VTQPGWYADPWAPTAQRWWDGQAWTGHTAPGLYGVLQPDPGSDLRREEQAARWASYPVIVQAVVTASTTIIGSFLFRHAVHDFFHQLDQLNSGDPNADSRPHVSLSGGLLAIQGITLLALAAEVFVIIWLERASSLAQRLGIPVARSHIWAVLGFFVPIVNFWFPYQVARDCLPPGHRGHGFVKRWWAWTITQQSCALLSVISIVSLPLGVGFAAVAGAASFAAAYHARSMFPAILAGHRQLLGR
jgi:hypothetical protein